MKPIRRWERFRIALHVVSHRGLWCQKAASELMPMISLHLPERSNGLNPNRGTFV